PLAVWCVRIVTLGVSDGLAAVDNKGVRKFSVISGSGLDCGECVLDISRMARPLRWPNGRLALAVAAIASEVRSASAELLADVVIPHSRTGALRAGLQQRRIGIGIISR